MPRKPRKIKTGQGLVRIGFLIEADIARQVDEEAARMTAEDPHGRVASRTDALRSLLLAGLASRKSGK